MLLTCSRMFSQEVITDFSGKDTFYTAIADSRVLNMIKPGRAPSVTIALTFDFNLGHMDAASSDNAVFHKSDFEYGRNFGTRYGFGATLIGKFSLHKEGQIRLNVGGFYQRFPSNFLIPESPEGHIVYNVFGGTLGLENSFTPDKRVKPYVGLDFVFSGIGGNATLTTDSTDYDVNIKTGFRMGAAFNFGFEYAFNNDVGMNLGYRLVYSNIIGKSSKESTVPNETYLNDDKIQPGVNIPFAGWKQFMYSTFHLGINFYIGMKAKK